MNFDKNTDGDFLGKMDLMPDVRSETERRLETLKLELGRTEQGALEARNVTRYRGVRFFGSSPPPSLPLAERDTILTKQ